MFNKKKRKIENFTDSEEEEHNSDDLVSSREGFDNISDLMTSGRRPGANAKRRNESDDKKHNKQPVLLSPKENHMPNGFEHPLTAKNGGKQGLGSPGDMSKHHDQFNIQSAGGVDSADEMTLDQLNYQSINQGKSGGRNVAKQYQTGTTSRTKTTQAVTSANLNSPSN